MTRKCMYVSSFKIQNTIDTKIFDGTSSLLQLIKYYSVEYDIL